MIESYMDAIEEFKRADHLFHVSLKYTRTVDVIRSVIQRIITTFEKGTDALLLCMKEEKAIDDVPVSPVQKVMLAVGKCPDEKICSYLRLYMDLRKIMKSDYTKREEYRRHVTMVTNYGGKPLEVDIDMVEGYYGMTAEFLRYLKERVEKYRE